MPTTQNSEDNAGKAYPLPRRFASGARETISVKGREATIDVRRLTTGAP